MLKTIKAWQLIILAISPSGVSAAVSSLTPGHCAGFMPVILEHQAKSAQESKVSEYSGGLHILEARRHREDAKRYQGNVQLMRELHSEQAASDFDSDYAYAADTAKEQAIFLSAATPEQYEQEPDMFKAVGNDIKSVTDVCNSILEDAINLGNSRALGTFFESITKDN